MKPITLCDEAFSNVITLTLTGEYARTAISPGDVIGVRDARVIASNDG